MQEQLTKSTARSSLAQVSSRLSLDNYLRSMMQGHYRVLNLLAKELQRPGSLGALDVAVAVACVGFL